MATIKDIAIEANVSPSTVSRALKKDKRIPLETQKKVEEVAARLKYQPNKFARYLVNKNYPDNTIGVVFPELIHRYFFELLQGIDEFISGTDYSLMIYNVGKGREAVFKRILAEGVNGLVIMGFTLTFVEKEMLKENGIPFVYLDIMDNDENYVTCDNYCGGQLIGDYFVRKKCSNVYYIGVNEKTTLQNDRLSGFEEILAKNNIRMAKTFIAKDEAVAEEVTLEILENNKDIDGLFYFCDEMAYGGVSALKKIGEKICIAGYDDLYPSRYIPLTTVFQPSSEMGFKGAKVIFDSINNNEKHLCQIVLRPFLQER